MKYLRIAVIPILIATVIVVAGCGSQKRDTTLKYIGHACFVLTASDGTRIAMDPYNTDNAPLEIRKFPKDISADVVTISHSHLDHSNSAGIGGNPRVIYLPGTYKKGNVRITGIAGDHGVINKVSYGPNTDFVFKIGKIKIVHLGAEGMITRASVLAAIDHADVVTFVAAGDIWHPAAKMIAQLRQHNVRTIIPIHYSLSKKNRLWNMATIDEFVKQLAPTERVVRESGSDLTVTAGMPTQVVVLTPSALSAQ